MGEARFDYQFGVGFEFQDTGLISKMVAGAASPHDAFRRFAEFLEAKEMQLLLACVVDAEVGATPAILFDDHAKAIDSNWSEMGVHGLCPVLEKAQALKFPFEALGASYPSRQELSAKRYIVELSRMGHREIAVVPVTVEGVLYIVVVGMCERGFSGKIKDLLVNVYGQFIAAFVTKFIYGTKGSEEKDSASANRKTEVRLTQREIALLTYTARGCSIPELSEKLGISEHTINIYNEVVCKKLGVTNVTQALINAIRLGVIEV